MAIDNEIAQSPPAPIALFAYRRPDHLRATLASLAANEPAVRSSLTIFCDGPRSPADHPALDEVRSIALHAEGFQNVDVITSDRNRGLSQSIIFGVTSMFQQHSSLIVLEDDMVTSPHFLDYMNRSLNYYADDNRVWCVHGYLFPVDSDLPDTFFLRGAECWGWATWRRAWARFEPHGERLLRQLKRRNLARAFDLNGGYPYTQLLKNQIRGRVDSWAIRWRASAFVNDGLCLWPGRSLLHNIGHDQSGEHCENTTQFDVTPSPNPIRITPIPVEEHRQARDALKAFFINARPPLRYRLKRILRRLSNRNDSQAP